MIKRFNIEYETSGGDDDDRVTGADMKECSYGPYILYSEHLKIVEKIKKRIKRQNVRSPDEIEKRIKKYKWRLSHHKCGAAHGEILESVRTLEWVLGTEDAYYDR